MRRDAQPPGHLGHRMAALSYLDDRFDLEFIRVPTARYPYLFVTHTRLQTSSDYKLLMYLDMKRSQRCVA